MSLDVRSALWACVMERANLGMRASQMESTPSSLPTASVSGCDGCAVTHNAACSSPSSLHGRRGEGREGRRRGEGSMQRVRVQQHQVKGTMRRAGLHAAETGSRIDVRHVGLKHNRRCLLVLHANVVNLRKRGRGHDNEAHAHPGCRRQSSPRTAPAMPAGHTSTWPVAVVVVKTVSDPKEPNAAAVRAWPRPSSPVKRRGAGKGSVGKRSALIGDGGGERETLEQGGKQATEARYLVARRANVLEH